MASLAPSGHNTQPWFVQYVEPLHWIIGNDKSKWLPGVAPTQRETILSIGAFLQNLEYAAGSFGYACQFDKLATTDQDENIVEIKLTKSTNATKYDSQQIKQRRTVRSNYPNKCFEERRCRLSDRRRTFEIIIIFTIINSPAQSKDEKSDGGNMLNPGYTVTTENTVTIRD